MDYRSQPQSDVAAFVAARLIDLLGQGKRVLWLLSGGSGATVCAQASQLLTGHDLSQLYVTMSDERYGAVGHPDENIQQLFDQGLTLPGATLYRPLQGASIEETTAAFAEWLTRTSQHVDYTITVLGIGEDGHTSGIKPHSIAASSHDAAVHYQGEDFERITTTSAYLRTIDEAIVQAYGASKHDVVEQLLRGGDDPVRVPMMIIHDIPRATFFSDYNKEEETI